MDEDLDARIRDLERQIGGLSGDEEEDQHSQQKKLFSQIDDLERQLEDEDDNKTRKPIKSSEQKTPPTEKRPPKAPLPKEETPSKRTKVPQPQTTQPSSKEGLPNVEEVSTLMSLEQLTKMAIKSNNKDYLAQIVSRKQKYMSLIRSGKIDHTFYLKGLNNKNPRDISNSILSSSVANEQQLFSKAANQQELFEKIVNKVKQTLPEQLEKAGIEEEKPKEFKAKSQFTPKPVAVNAQQKQLIQKINQQGPEKKLELLLVAMAKLQSLIEYFKLNMPEKKLTQLETQLLPLRDYGFKLVGALKAKKNIPTGEFQMLYLPKINFEFFHGLNRKDFVANINTVVDKLKSLQLAEREFRKKIGRSNKNAALSLKLDQQLKIYEEDLEYLGTVRNKEFAPIPTIKMQSEEREFFTENTKLQPNHLQLLIKQADGFNGNVELKIYFDQAQNPKSVFHINPGAQNIDLILRVHPDTLKDIHNKSIRLKMQCKKMLMFTSDLMAASVDLHELENKNSFEGVILVNNIKMSYEVNMRLPVNKQSKVKVELMRVKRVPEYVHTKEFEQDFVRQVLHPGSTKPQPAQPQPKIPSQPPSDKSNPHTQPPPPSSKPKTKLVYPQRNPQIIQKLRSPSNNIPAEIFQKPEVFCDSLNYLTQMDPILDKATNELYSYKPNRRIIEDIQDEIMKKRMMLESYSRSGKLTPEEYTANLEKSLKMDQVLMKAYGAAGLKEFAEFVNARIDILIGEINELRGVEPEVEAKSQPPSTAAQQHPTKTTQEHPPVHQQPPSKGLDLSAMKLFFVRRTPELTAVLDSVTAPMEFVQVDKIKKPELSSMSVKYLSQFDVVLDQAINEYSIGDKLNKKLAESIQDQVMKLKMISTKRKETMPPEHYIQTVRGFIDFDLKLRAIYKRLKLPELEKFVLSRIRICKAEIGEKLFLEEEKPCSFDTEQDVPLFDLKKTPQALQAISKYSAPIQQPELPEFCPCLTYIESMIQISSNPQLKQSLQRKKQDFEKSFAEDTFDQDDYLSKLKKCRQEDIQRLDVYKKAGLEDFYLFIKARIHIIDGELANS